MSIALASAALAGFTACSDDDDVIEVIAPEKLTFSDDAVRVKIGEENRIALPIATGNGDYHAYSLTPEIADVFQSDKGDYLIEGYKNGTAEIVVSDAGNNYKRLQVAVYTTDVMKLSDNSFNFVSVLGTQGSNSDCKVAEGNGGYTIESDNPNVTASIDEEGTITIVATSRMTDYTAVLTVTDCTGLTATISVTVKASLDGWTTAEIEDIKAETGDVVFGQCKDPSDGTSPYYFGWYNRPEYWVDSDNNGVHTIGWWFNYYGVYDYGGIKIEYPTGASLNTEVDGKLYYQYSYIDWYSRYEYAGKVKVVRDDDTARAVIFWNIDLENERINRGYVVHQK